MSAISAPQATQATSDSAPLTFGGILRSEWIKLTSLRSTVWSYALIVLLSLGLGILLAVTFNPGMTPQGNPVDVDPEGARSFTLLLSTAGLMIGQLIAGVLGVLVISGEYSTGMIRSTLAAVPRRLLVLWAKAIVLFVTTTGVGLLTVLLVFGATAPIRATKSLSTNLFDPEFALALLGGALYLGLVSVFALGLGTLLRSGAGAIAATLGLILVLPVVLQMFSMIADWARNALPYLISNAGQSMFTIPQERPTDLPPGVDLGPIPLDAGPATLVVLAWAIVTLALGAIALRRRDA